MGQLVLLVVAAAWAAVLIPPLLRSRVENRPNSSVTDFRKQLSRLQSTVPARAGGSLRPVGRPLAPSPSTRGAQRHGVGHRAHVEPRSRTHGADMREASVRRHAETATSVQRSHRQPPHRQTQVRRPNPAQDLRRRRTNVLFVLALTAASTLFLAATTKATVMLYLFALAFLALCGYVYLLSQLRQREQQTWPAAWPAEHGSYR